MKYLYLISVVLLLVGFSIGCKKKSTTTPVPAPTGTAYAKYMAKMGGVRNWHGTRWGWSENPACSSCPRSYYSSEVTASGEIGIVDSSRISWGSYTLSFESYDTIKGMLTFLYYFPVEHVTYYYTGDSMKYEYIDQGIHFEDHETLSTP